MLPSRPTLILDNLPGQCKIVENIDLKSPEDTTLFTDEEDVTVNRVDFEFEQSNKVRGIYRKITVFNGSHCYQSIKDKHQRKYKYRIDISCLNPSPYRQHHIAWKWLFLAVCAALVTATLVLVGWFTDLLGESPSVYYTITAIAAASVTLIVLLLFVHNSYDRVIFKTQFGNTRLIELLNNYPDKEDFMKFVGKFILQIRKAKIQKEMTQEQFLAKELQELRRLRDEAVITDSNYQNAKRLILGNF